MKNIGFLTFILLDLMGIFILWKWPAQRHHSFSRHITLNRTSRRLFALSFTAVALLSCLFLAGWFGPAWQMGEIYYVLVAIITIGQLVIAWVPATQGISLKIHNIAALSTIFSMLFIVYVVVMLSSLSLQQFIASVLFLLFGVYTLFLFKFVPKAHAEFLFYELSYFVLFWITILILTYTQGL